MAVALISNHLPFEIRDNAAGTRATATAHTPRTLRDTCSGKIKHVFADTT